jgi:hypothetical protein
MSIPKKPDLEAPGVTELEATDPPPKPIELTAKTLNAAAALPIAGTNALFEVPSTDVVQVPTPPSITYCEIDVLPSLAGALQVTLKPPSAGTTVTFCGAPGTENVIEAVALCGDTARATNRRDDVKSETNFEFILMPKFYWLALT